MRTLLFLLIFFGCSHQLFAKSFLPNKMLPNDTLEYHIEALDSSYNQPNQKVSKIKVAFPFLWVDDLNKDREYQFSEFQYVTPYFTGDQHPKIAVNYEFNGTLDSLFSLQLSLIDAKEGKVAFTNNWSPASINKTKSVNELEYFDIPLAEIVTGEYYYQVLMLDENNDAISSYFNSIFLEGLKLTALEIEQQKTDSLTILSDSLSKEIENLEQAVCCCIDHSKVLRIVANSFTRPKKRKPTCYDEEFEKCE